MQVFTKNSVFSSISDKYGKTGAELHIYNKSCKNVLTEQKTSVKIPLLFAQFV